MRHKAIAVATAGLMLTATLAFAQATQTLTGTISDAMCANKHMMKGASAAKCTRECVKQGSDYALVVGTKVYTLKGDKAEFDKMAGESVTVTGTTSGSSLTVASIKAAK